MMDDEDVISKKELLELTGISYGQLYRWKRKQLIPEEWFIRRATFTGQETFFPKAKMLARLAKIKDLKEDVSLDDLADLFSPNPLTIALTAEGLIARRIAGPTSLEVFAGQHGVVEDFSFMQILSLYLLETLLQAGDITLEESAMLLQTVEEHYSQVREKQCELLFLRKRGISSCCLLSPPGEIYFDGGTRVITRLNITSCIEALKLKLGN